jgi:steroid delta-isomerase
MVAEERVRGAVRRYMEAWGGGKRRQLLELFAEDGEMTDPVGTQPLVGREAIGEFWDFAHQDEEKTITHRPEKIVVCANEALLEFVIEVRLPNNSGLDLRAFNHFVVNEQGQIQTLRAFWDESCMTQPEGMDLFMPDMG